MTPILNCVLHRLAQTIAFVVALAFLPFQAIGNGCIDAVLDFKSDIKNRNKTIDLGIIHLGKPKLEDKFLTIPCNTDGDLEGAKVSKGTVTAVAVSFLNTALKVERILADCNSDGIQDTLPDPIVSGKKLVCPNEETTYTTPFVANGSTWEWTLASGGTITQVTNNSIKIRWNNQPGSSLHKLTVKETNNAGCSKTVEFYVSIKDITLRCIGSFNISMDNTCKLTLTTEMILAGAHIGSSDMKLQVLTGTTILEEGIGFGIFRWY